MMPIGMSVVAQHRALSSTLGLVHALGGFPMLKRGYKSTRKQALTVAKFNFRRHFQFGNFIRYLFKLRSMIVRIYHLKVVAL